MAEGCFKNLKREPADNVCEKDRCSASSEEDKAGCSDTTGSTHDHNVGRKSDLKNIFDSIALPEFDKDTAIILFFLMFLYKNGADLKLLIALAYILL